MCWDGKEKQSDQNLVQVNKPDPGPADPAELVARHRVPCGHWGWGELLTWARGSSSFFNYNTDLIGIKIIIVEDIVTTLLRLPVVGGRWAEPGSNAKQGRMLNWFCLRSVSLSALYRDLGYSDVIFVSAFQI